jgi:hypothetical protein
MYSGTTLKPLRHFDAWFGAHQKIDRVARDHLDTVYSGEQFFPSRKAIIRFEGMDGPDGIKRKTPAQDELWHFINPENLSDNQIVDVLRQNYDQLVSALREQNRVRAAFEAAWLAHGIVDGLTPAHHYPYEDEMVRLRGEGIETRTSPKEKLIMPGETLPERMSKNWQVWGDKGLITTHFAFEWGIAVMITPLRLRRATPTVEELAWATELGLEKLFLTRTHQIAAMRMYEQFYKSGWTPHLANQARRELVPLIVNTVTLAWYLAMHEAYEGML